MGYHSWSDIERSFIISLLLPRKLASEIDKREADLRTEGLLLDEPASSLSCEEIVALCQEHWSQDEWWQTLSTLAIEHPAYAGSCITALLEQGTQPGAHRAVLLAGDIALRMDPAAVPAECLRQLKMNLRSIPFAEIWNAPFDHEQPELFTKRCEEVGRALLTVTDLSRNDSAVYEWLKQVANTDACWYARAASLWIISKKYPQDNDTRSWLQAQVTENLNRSNRLRALICVADNCHENLDLLSWLERQAISHADEFVQSQALEIVWRRYGNAPGVFEWLKQQAEENTSSIARSEAVRAVGALEEDDEECLIWLRQEATENADDFCRSTAIRTIASRFDRWEFLLPWLKEQAVLKGRNWAQSTALRLVARRWRAPAAIDWLKEQASKNGCVAARCDAIESVATFEKDKRDCLDWLKKVACENTEHLPRGEATKIVALIGRDHELTLPWLQEQALQNSSAWARMEAADAIRNLFEDPAVLLWLEANKTVLPGPNPWYVGSSQPPYWLNTQIQDREDL